MPRVIRQNPLYAVVFDNRIHDEDSRSYTPFAPAPLVNNSEFTVPHGLSKPVSEALTGLWYCLHLPNAAFETVDVTANVLLKQRELRLNHNILLVPISGFNQELCSAYPDHFKPMLVVCPDSLLTEATEKSKQIGFSLPPICYSAISNENLKAHWKEIHDILIPDVEYLGNEPRLTRRLDSAIVELPRRWLARQFQAGSEQRVAGSTDDLDAFIFDASQERAVLAGTVRLENENASFEEADRQMPQVILEEMRRESIPLTLAFPGVSASYARRSFDDNLRRTIMPMHRIDTDDTWDSSIAHRSDQLIERAAIEFIATHRTLGTSGAGYFMPSVPPDAFAALATLEKHFSYDTIRASSVWTLLGRLDKAARNLWGDYLVGMVRRASSITVFSDFPIGLLRLPGDSAPLSARLPICYRPLTPLTRAIQQELQPAMHIDLGRKMRVLVAECIPTDDTVGLLSRMAWSAVKGTFDEYANGVSIILAETLNRKSLQQAVARHSPDILIISAHGAVVGNAAGLVIGKKEFCLELGFDVPPPLVILSACHVAPRGAGAISVTDLLLREGVFAVLGTQIPVDVRHNAVLTSRFLVNIAEAQADANRHQSLLEIWHMTQSGNAVNDVLSPSNRSLHEWGLSRGPDGQTVLADFMMNRSVGRLRNAHIYEDTEAVLGEMAEEQGMGDAVRNWFRRPGYVPESLFYLFAGNPDRIFVSTLQDRYSRVTEGQAF